MSLQGPGSQNNPGSYADLVALLRGMDQRLAKLERGDALGPAGIVARPGMLASIDYDGEGPDLGTTGWMLGSTTDGGPSRMILNGVDVYADLAAKTAAIATEVARINALVNAQVDGTTGSASASVSLGTSPGGYAPITFTVPAGFSRAQVTAISSMYMGGIVASVLQTQIAGNNGPEQFAFTNAAYANASASHAHTLTGLTGGNITVRSVAKTSTGSTSGVIITTASVMWLR